MSDVRMDITHKSPTMASTIPLTGLQIHATLNQTRQLPWWVEVFHVQAKSEIVCEGGGASVIFSCPGQI